MKSIKKQLRDAIEDKVADTVSRPEVPAQMPSVGPITDAVMQEVAPQIEHLTNQEPFIRSRVSLGSSSTVIGALYLLGYTIYQTGDVPGPEVAVPVLVMLWGGSYSLWGRWIAKKPLGA